MCIYIYIVYIYIYIYIERERQREGERLCRHSLSLRMLPPLASLALLHRPSKRATNPAPCAKGKVPQCFCHSDVHTAHF